MMIEIHIYHHILTGDVAALQAEVDRLKAEALTPENLATIDDMTAEANGLAADAGPAPPAPTPMTR
jgi:hypothetical protein